jgi:uncharacterized protein YndB with AHSA1/START domain
VGTPTTFEENSMPNVSRLMTGLLLAATGSAAMAGTSSVSPGGFTVTVERSVTTSPDKLYQSIQQIGKWWNGSHTWSGDSANLSLQLTAGGCLCERWTGGQVEHGRVLFTQNGKLVRLNAPLGPLQALPVTAILTFEIADRNGSAALRVTYAVAGGGMDLSTLAQPVDGVITEQVDRLVKFAVG